MSVSTWNKFGFLKLSNIDDGSEYIVKANKIHSINMANNFVVVGSDAAGGIPVFETLEDIIEQLENIHPSLR